MALLRIIYFRWLFLRITLTSTGASRSTFHNHLFAKTLPLSGTTGKKLYKYDLATLGEVSEFPISPVEVFDDHEDTIRDLTCHPWQSELVMTAR